MAPFTFRDESRYDEKRRQRRRIFHVFLNGKLRFWSLYVFFTKKNFWVKNKDTIPFTNNFDLFA